MNMLLAFWEREREKESVCVCVKINKNISLLTNYKSSSLRLRMLYNIFLKNCNLRLLDLLVIRCVCLSALIYENIFLTAKPTDSFFNFLNLGIILPKWNVNWSTRLYYICQYCLFWTSVSAFFGFACIFKLIL